MTLDLKEEKGKRSVLITRALVFVMKIQDINEYNYYANNFSHSLVGNQHGRAINHFHLTVVSDLSTYLISDSRFLLLRLIMIMLHI